MISLAADMLPLRIETAMLSIRQSPLSFDQPPNPPLEWDRLPAQPAGTLRGFAAPAAPQLAR